MFNVEATVYLSFIVGGLLGYLFAKWQARR